MAREAIHVELSRCTIAPSGAWEDLRASRAPSRIRITIHHALQEAKCFTFITSQGSTNFSPVLQTFQVLFIELNDRILRLHSSVW